MDKLQEGDRVLAIHPTYSNLRYRVGVVNKIKMLAVFVIQEIDGIKYGEWFPAEYLIKIPKTATEEQVEALRGLLK